jgi:hypothetical protein
VQFFKTIAILCVLSTLQACSNTPRTLNYFDRLKVVGGSESQAQEAAFMECKKGNPFFFEIEMVNEHFNVEGKVRDFKCRFWETKSELDRPSSLQQRILQTRKFSKSTDELHNGIQAWITHSGGSGYVAKAQPIIENNKVTYPKKGDMRVNFTGKIQPTLHISGIYYYADEGAVNVRIRTFAGNDEVFSPKLYQLIFNQIAQELFTQAIKLEPAEVK